jgi:hypothetical protein
VRQLEDLQARTLTKMASRGGVGSGDTRQEDASVDAARRSWCHHIPRLAQATPTRFSVAHPCLPRDPLHVAPYNSLSQTSI